MVNIKWATPLCMRSLSDNTPGQSLTPLATTVTTICRLPESSAQSVTCLWTSVAVPSLKVWCPLPHPHAIPNMKSHSSTQRPDPSNTHGRDRPCCDVSTQQSGISPGSSPSHRRTSMTGVHLHPAPTPVHSEIELVHASSWHIHSATRPQLHLRRRAPPLRRIRSTGRHQTWLFSLKQRD